MAPLLDLTQNYFSLFGIEPHFDVDLTALTLRYREIQSATHPDRFVGKSDQEQRIAVQSAARVNEAYQSLKTPLLRAEYLLRLKGFELSQEERTHQDTDFLMEQMQLRENLEVIRQQKAPLSALEEWFSDIAQRIHYVQEGFGKAFEAGNNTSAMDSVLKWKFLVKLQADAEKLREHLEQD